MNSRITVRFGHVSFKTRTCKIIAFALDEEAGGSCPIHKKLTRVADIGSIMSNGVDNRNGVWYGNTFDAEEDDNTVILFKHIQKFGTSVVASSILPVRLRSTGPMQVIKGGFPFIKGFAHQNDLMIFSGRADILTWEDLEALGYDEYISDMDWERGFDEEEQDACYNITTTKSNLSGYQERPEFVSVEADDGERVGVALPKPFARRVRVTAAPKPESPRRRRRRSS